MAVEYHGGYMWPPRPERPAPRDMLGSFEGTFACQAKMNGQCTVLDWDGRALTVWDRHQNVQRWYPPPQMLSVLLPVLGDESMALAGELLHAKVKGIRDTLFLFDVLAHRGRRLEGTRFVDRVALMRRLFPGGTDHGTHRDVGGGLWIAKTYASGLSSLYDSWIDRPEVEGLVLKLPNARLSNCMRRAEDASWQIKVRKPTRKYSF